MTFSQGRFLIYKKRRSLERQTKVPHIEEQKDVVDTTILRTEHVTDQVIEFDNKYSKTLNFVESISMSLHTLH